MPQEKEFLKLFTKAQPALFRYICTMLANANEADDILQETAITAWEKFADFDQSRSFQGWLFGISKYKILHSKRRYARTLNLLTKAQELKAQDFFEHKSLHYFEEQQDALEGCIKSISISNAKLLMMRYTEKLNSKQIAKKLNWSPEKVRITLYRLRGVLKTCINEKMAQKS